MTTETPRLDHDEESYCPSIDLHNKVDNKKCHIFAHGFLCIEKGCSGCPKEKSQTNVCIKENSDCIRVVMNKLTWDQASHICQNQFGSNLATAQQTTDFNINMYIRKSVNYKNILHALPIVNHFFWLGLSEPKPKNDYSFFDINQLHIRADCNDSKPFVCLYDSNSSESIYVNLYNFTEAVQICASKGSDMPSIWDSKQEQKIRYNKTWIALRRASWATWRLGDGRTIDDFSVRGKDGNCVYFEGRDYYTADCFHAAAGYICKGNASLSMNSCVGCDILKCFNIKGICYVIFDEKTSWYSAREKCASMQFELEGLLHKEFHYHINFLKSTYKQSYGQYWVNIRKEDWLHVGNSQKGETYVGESHWIERQSMVVPSGTCAVAYYSQEGRLQWEPAACHHKHHVTCTNEEPSRVENKKVSKNPLHWTLPLAIAICVCGVCFSVVFIRKRSSRRTSERDTRTATPAETIRETSTALYDEIPLQDSSSTSNMSSSSDESSDVIVYENTTERDGYMVARSEDDKAAVSVFDGASGCTSQESRLPTMQGCLILYNDATGPTKAAKYNNVRYLSRSTSMPSLSKCFLANHLGESYHKDRLLSLPNVNTKSASEQG